MDEDIKSTSDQHKAYKLQKFFNLLHSLEASVFRVFFPYEAYGNLTDYSQGSLIIVGNHYSVLDVAYPLRITRRPIHFIAKQELWKKGFMKWFTKKCECIPAKRDGTDVETIKASLRVLKDGGVINIFPEGTRNHSYEDLLPFYGGAAALSIKTRTPIVPVVKIKKTKLFRKNYVVYGDPIEFSAYYGKKITREQLEECDNTLRNAMRNMRKAFIVKRGIKFKSNKV